jgi:hypothetical protein
MKFIFICVSLNRFERIKGINRAGYQWGGLWQKKEGGLPLPPSN